MFEMMFENVQKRENVRNRTRNSMKFALIYQKQLKKNTIKNLEFKNSSKSQETRYLGWTPKNFSFFWKILGWAEYREISKFSFSSRNCHFWMKITKMIYRLNSRILTNSLYIWISRCLVPKFLEILNFNEEVIRLF